MEIAGDENIPLKGGVLLVSNHISLADPPVIGGCATRPLYFFAKEELFRIPFFGWLIRQINAFPVKRYEHDVGAFKTAQMLLKSGQAVLVFPEGRRSKTGSLGKAKPGAALLAFKTGVPVVPVCIQNTHRLSSFRKVKVSFGKPIYPLHSGVEKKKYRLFADSILAAIAQLADKDV